MLVRIRPPPINRRGSGGGSRWGLGNVSRARPAPGDDGDGASSMPSSSSPAGLAPGARPPETAWTGRPAATRRASFSFFPWGKELRRRCTHCARQTTAGGHLRLSGRAPDPGGGWPDRRARAMPRRRRASSRRALPVGARARHRPGDRRLCEPCRGSRRGRRAVRWIPAGGEWKARIHWLP